MDLDTVDMADVSITPDDPRWVGAWWIGFILSGMDITQIFHSFLVVSHDSIRGCVGPSVGWLDDP